MVVFKYDMFSILVYNNRFKMNNSLKTTDPL